ncbi:Uu.00g100540.m01.CDS01 [Anthostomella pinea]|uniref:Uu.00g100540.m01.CDS01 n=1 Tax=Anthostomella pinea TaxID=933095 RepID=A0AAI8VCV8_9PEZI|nr:Uu.00g100540.m01.CDS01 [Anthostomella pinea]
MAAATCKVCDDPLVLEVDDDEEGGNAETQPVPDDLELSCGCHFHWQCLLDQSSEIAISLKCPSCDSQVAANTAGPSVTNPFLHASSGASILTRYKNEGGVQENLDILPAVTEEAYLEANPAARPARAFHVMCCEGDFGGIVELLRDADQADGEEPTMDPAQLLRYQDPLADKKSGLHLAVEKRQEEVVWLLLWIASSLSTETFPEPAMQAAQAMGLHRPATSASDDIRSLRDDQGRTAETVAAEMGGVWAAMLQAGALHPGSSLP